MVAPVAKTILSKLAWAVRSHPQQQHFTRETLFCRYGGSYGASFKGLSFIAENVGSNIS